MGMVCWEIMKTSLGNVISCNLCINLQRSDCTTLQDLVIIGGRGIAQMVLMGLENLSSPCLVFILDLVSLCFVQ